MAEEQETREREDLSEEPSQYRLEDFRKKGRVAQSREVSAFIGLLATGVTLYFTYENIGGHLGAYMTQMFKADWASALDLSNQEILSSLFFQVVKIIGVVGLPVVLAGLVMGVLGSFIQVGPVFSVDPLRPDLSRIDPMKGLKRFFSLKQFLDGIRLVLRATIIVAVAFFLVKARIFESVAYILSEPVTLVKAYQNSGSLIFLSLCAILLLFAGFDFWLQRWEFGKGVRLTRQEGKEEHKEHEGDPLIKARIRSVQKEVFRRRMMQAVKKADVVVTNPTHFAVAITYDKDKMNAPKVVAKGLDFLAQRIKKVATENGVPLVENPPLARTLYKSVKIGQAIPRALYKAVAEVLAYVYRLKKKRFG